MKLINLNFYFTAILLVSVSGSALIGQDATSEGFDIETALFASGYNRPCGIISAGDDRLFVVQQSGEIRILLTDGTQIATPFLDISDLVDSSPSNSEKGLLGLAFPPNYNQTGYFFVNYTVTEGGVLYTRVSRFSTDPENAQQGLPDSELVLLQYVQDFSNHNGGQLEFSPIDGYLYIASGDGGSGGDPNNRAQNLNSYLGKMHRIDINTEPYAIPEDNPFAGVFGLDEIWAYGLRNPWKFAFDSETGDMYIGDVGQSNREEINFEPASSSGGVNYGWRCFEGTIPFNSQGCQAPSAYQLPVFDYPYGNGPNGFRCSVTGGRVYRGSVYGNLSGKYIFADYCANDYWVAWQEDEEWNVVNKGGFISGAVAFGADDQGELYVVKGNNGTIHKISEACSLLEAVIMVENETELSVEVAGADSYTWYQNGELYGSNQSSIIADENGIYTVVVTTQNGCTLTSAGFEVMGLSNYNETVVGSFKIFPNPAHGLARIEVSLLESVENPLIAVYSIDGRFLFSTKMLGAQTELDIEHLASGIYIVQIISEGSSLAQQRLVKY